MWNGNKYRAKKVTTEDGTFDSKAELHRWQELKLLAAAGEIRDLRRQVEYVLIPEQREPGDGKKKGKLIERKCSYVADFVYEKDGETVVEDAKGVKTKEYIIKRKLMLDRYGIRIREV